ncbi:hypothetical protein CPB85DRAFT_1251986 [Mucidula mucida]|nr:hypothetical protein CPB85DRAFT_1251986 [Mucidula mucida]
MGQRHQVFVIAKVIPHGGTQAYYRCIAAWHHQWCYGRLPLLATRRFITLLKQKNNAALVQYEIASFTASLGDMIKPRTSVVHRQAWNVDIEIKPKPYFSGGTFFNSLLDASMGSSHGDNNDGITVIDVTTPAAPHYCFVSLGGIEAQVQVDAWTPLTAEQYARAYYPSGEQDEAVETSVRSVIATLDDTKLMTIEMLAEAWPDEYTVPEGAPEATPPPVSNSDPVPSLASLALGPAVDAALASGDISDLVKLLWIPEKAIALRAFLQSKSPFPDAGISLLVEIVKHFCQSTESVDLEGLSLNSDQIVKVLSELKDIRSLTLPSVPEVTIDTVRRVLSAHNNIAHFVLLGTGVSSNALGDLIADEPKLFYSIQRLVHPYIFQYNDDVKGVRYVNAFTYYSPPGGLSYEPNIASIPLLHPAQVVQALTDALGPSVDPPDFWYPNTSAFFPHIVLVTDVREAGRPWSERHLSFFPRSCANAFRGEGWCFINKTNGDQMMTMRGGSDELYYGFVKFDPRAIKQKGKAEKETEKADEDADAADPPRHLICDFKQFLKVLEDEGRPSPSTEAVEKLDDIFRQLGEKRGIRLIKEEELAGLIG